MNIHWKYILYSFAVALLTTACSKDSIDDIPESEKTSIQVTAEMATGAISAQSRAGEGSYTAGTTEAFADGKKFAVAVYRNGDTRTTPTAAHKETKMGTTIVTYKDSKYTYSAPTGGSSLLYWDDFGGYSANLDAVGLCTGDGDVPTKLYSEGKLIFPANAPTEEEDNAKTINWSLDNTAGNHAYKADEDLCVSGYLTGEQHSTGAKGGTWPTCKFNSTNNAAFQHVLSKITVSLTADPTSYGGSFPSGDTKVTINGIVRKGTVNLYNRNVTPSTTGADKINITANATRTGSEGPYTVSFLAMPNVLYDGTDATTEFMKIVVPSTISGQVNNYSVPTQIIYNLLKTAATETNKSAVGVDVENEITLKSGVHYYINLIVKKQEITVVAQIKDWDVVETDPAEAPIVFTNDIKNETVADAERFENGFKFYRKSKNEANYSASGSPAYSYADGKWTTTDNLFYWESSEQQYYFRALYPTTTATNASLEAVNTDAYNTYKDIYWGTTAAHTWGSDNIAEGAPVNPRTGPVKMIFYPILSKIQVNVVTTTEDNKVDLSYQSSSATVTIKNTVKTAKIDLHNSLTLASENTDYSLTWGTDAAGGESAKITFGKEEGSPADYFDYVIPQSLVNTTDSNKDAVIEITVQTSAGPLTYSTKLRNVKVKDSETKVTEWERGKKYIYTITIKKTGIEINAQLVDWIPKEGEVEVPFFSPDHE